MAPDGSADSPGSSFWIRSARIGASSPDAGEARARWPMRSSFSPRTVRPTSTAPSSQSTAVTRSTSEGEDPSLGGRVALHVVIHEFQPEPLWIGHEERARRRAYEDRRVR